MRWSPKVLVKAALDFLIGRLVGAVWEEVQHDHQVPHSFVLGLCEGSIREGPGEIAVEGHFDRLRVTG